ncbi:DNA-binding protein [Streptomyces piniterrae]|uniref:DNA-binding protein n=1 Tax=Streptomyces piniterrae TaxID=2571125 RepID=A0A4U0MWD6_9ACTN|nr:DUF5753 domain-containing protein [Streptomyces piniterrae]TJZ45395.1 DNA-binding protein [Streptomyces piniterrae]
MNTAYEPNGWDALHRQGMGPTQQAFLDLVRRTKDTKRYCANVIWGNLQTADYVRAMLRLVVDFLGTPDDIEAGVQGRIARAGLIGKEGRTYHVVLAQEAMRTNIGGPGVMRAQLARLLEAVDLPGLTLGIIPDRAERHVYPGHSFGIFDGKRVEVELYGGSPTYTDQKQIDAYEKAFSLLERSAVYGDAARALIRGELAALEVSEAKN